MLLGLSKIPRHPCWILQKCTIFRGSSTHLSTYLKSPSNIDNQYLVLNDLSLSDSGKFFKLMESIVQAQGDMSKSKAIERKKSDIPKYALISTSKGLITLELYKDGSPDVVDEFIDFSQKGHFKGMQFSRVIKNFVIHGSKVERPEATEDWTSRGKHYSQLDTSLKHEAFMLGTSKVKHEDGGFDLFITTAPIPDLNDKINVFGRVIKGEDVVQEIEEVDTDDHYRPKTPVQINEVTLKHKI